MSSKSKLLNIFRILVNYLILQQSLFQTLRVEHVKTLVWWEVQYKVL